MVKTKTQNTKRNNRFAAIIFAAIIAICVIAVVCADGNPLEGIENTLGREKITQPADFTVYCLDAGQADCTLIICDGCTMLIDAGENGGEYDVFRLLDSQGVTHLDYVVATHPHTDHIGGMPEVLESYGAGSIIMPEVSREAEIDNSSYYEMLDAVKNGGTDIIYSQAGYTFSLGSALVGICGPVTYDDEEMNNNSVLIKITYGNNSFLFMGDAEEDEELSSLMEGENLDCDFLRVGHHGSSGSSCEKFLSAATPDYCVISVGADNSYGHPADETLERLSKYTDKIYRTDVCGMITVTSDGENINISY